MRVCMWGRGEAGNKMRGRAGDCLDWHQNNDITREVEKKLFTRDIQKILRDQN